MLPILRRYELVLQLDPTKGEAVDDHHGLRVDRATELICRVFNNASLISDNGGLLTYRVPQASMRVGVAFAALEEHREELGLSDYHVAQPTLEQVFVQTVLEHDADLGPTLAQRNGGFQQHVGTVANENSERMKEEEAVAVDTAVNIEENVSPKSPVRRYHHVTSLPTRNDDDTHFRNDASTALETGLRKEWLGCSRRVHRSTCILMTLFMIAAYIAIVPFSIGYVFFPFVASFLVCVVACVGCCCVIPDDPDDINE